MQISDEMVQTACRTIWGNAWGVSGEALVRRALEAVLGEREEDARALRAYRATTSWIGSDSWDGCPDCMAILKAAFLADQNRELTPDETALALAELRALAPRPIPPSPDWKGIAKHLSFKLKTARGWVVVCHESDDALLAFRTAQESDNGG
jgi:hypothetical protein